MTVPDGTFLAPAAALDRAAAGGVVDPGIERAGLHSHGQVLAPGRRERRIADTAAIGQRSWSYPFWPWRPAFPKPWTALRKRTASPHVPGLSPTCQFAFVTGFVPDGTCPFEIAKRFAVSSLKLSDSLWTRAETV